MQRKMGLLQISADPQRRNGPVLDPLLCLAGGGAAAHTEPLEPEETTWCSETEKLARLLLEHELVEAVDHVQAAVLVAAGVGIGSMVW